ncbi:hypothetical protein BHM03_00043787 [Ensete ventricosum]|nr:hypothetical protein BHM03_00043787 [Ensete ventricosum]
MVTRHPYLRSLLRLLLTMSSYFVVTSVVLVVRCTTCLLPLGKIGLAPPYLCQVDRMTTDPPILVSGPIMSGQPRRWSNYPGAQERDSRRRRRRKKKKKMMMMTEVVDHKRRGHDGFVLGNLSGEKRLKAAVSPKIGVQEKKDKIGERVSKLQQLVSPFGKVPPLAPPSSLLMLQQQSLLGDKAVSMAGAERSLSADDSDEGDGEHSAMDQSQMLGMKALLRGEHQPQLLHGDEPVPVAVEHVERLPHVLLLVPLVHDAAAERPELLHVDAPVPVGVDPLHHRRELRLRDVDAQVLEGAAHLRLRDAAVPVAVEHLEDPPQLRRVHPRRPGTNDEGPKQEEEAAEIDEGKQTEVSFLGNRDGRWRGIRGGKRRAALWKPCLFSPPLPPVLGDHWREPLGARGMRQRRRTAEEGRRIRIRRQNRPEYGGLALQL